MSDLTLTLGVIALGLVVILVIIYSYYRWKKKPEKDDLIQLDTPKKKENWWKKEENKWWLWLPIIGGILILLFTIWSPMDHPKVFAVGVIALLVMASFYSKWDKVFTGNIGKKTVHGLLVVGVIVTVLMVTVPNELWHRYVGFNPFSYITVKDSEKAAEKARELLASQEDEEVKTEINRIADNLKKTPPQRPTAGEQALIKLYGQMKDDEKIFVLRPKEWVNVTEKGLRANVYRLDQNDCYQGRLGEELLPPTGKCEGKLSIDPPRTSGQDYELTSLTGKTIYVKVVWVKA